MKIAAVEVFVTSPGRNFVTLKITTDTALTGLGDATLNGRETAVAAYLRDHVAPALIGRDPQQIEDTWQFLYRGAYWRRGPVTMAAIAAVDTALWDIKGKVAGLPLYQLLGGASRTGVLVYAHAYGADTETLIEAVQRLVDDGYEAIRVQAAVPGLAKTYGVPVDGVESYEPAGTDLPQAEVWDTDSYLESAPAVIRDVRAHFGSRLKLLHDVHHRLTPIEAARLGKALEPYRLFWMEDPTPAEDQESFALIRQHTVTPLAVGEVFNSIWDCRSLISNRLIDYIRTAVTHAGGITHLRRIFDFAHLYGVRTGSHGPSDLSPIALAASLHLGLAVPNFGIQEYMGHPAQAAEVFRTRYRRDGAMMHPGDTAGLGVEFDEEAAARYPFRPRSLPYARLVDGTVHDW